MDLLKQFDKAQLFRFFVDGRFQKKYAGWVGYEAGERGSVQALLNGFAFMVDNFDLSQGLRCTYLLDLHKTCMLSIETENKKSSPGDIRYLNAGMPFFAKTTTLENIQEIFALRKDDGTAVFNNQKYAKTANELDANTIYEAIQNEGKLNYRNWYPVIDIKTQLALEKKASLHEFYQAKHHVQMLFVDKVEAIVFRYNNAIKSADSDDERLRCIALVVRELELLHPFPDGNCRTFACVLLTQMLLYYGFYPAILSNPNLDGEYSLDQWITEIKHGMACTKLLLENPQARIYEYSILDAQPEDRKTFLNMAKVFIDKINNVAEIYLTPIRLAEYTDGYWLNGCDAYLTFTGVGTYNTYNIGNIYFVLQLDDWMAEKKDIADEIQKIIQKGIKAIVLDRPEYAKGINIPVFMVNNAFSAFKKTAIKVRQEVDCMTILVTGTEGKTGAKVQLHHLLKYQAQTHAVLNSANTEIPVLRSLINLNKCDKIEINEVSVGSDEAYRVERAKMVNPNICLFTNIGPNHMDMHKTMDNLLAAKSSVVEGLREGGFCIVNAANDYYLGLVAAIRLRKPGLTILTYGKASANHAYLESASINQERLGWDLSAVIDGERVDYFLPLFQQHAPLMSVGILLTIKKSGYDIQQAAKNYADLEPFETMGRLLKLTKQEGEVLFYDQSRRGGIQGMRSAFNDLKNFNVKGKIVALVGGVSVKKDGEWTQEVHRQLAELINNSPIARLYTTGNYMEYVHQQLTDKTLLVTHTDDLDALTDYLMSDIKAGDLLFIIGSAYLYLGRVSDKLLNYKDKDKFDPAIKQLKLTESDVLQYRVLLVFEAVANGLPVLAACNRYAINEADYQKWHEQCANYRELRAALLMYFFSNVDVVIENKLIKNINHSLAVSGHQSYIYSKEFCHQWFNNHDNIKNQEKKQLFGSFYHFGHDEYILHIEVATQHLHIGLVKYTKNDENYKIIKMQEAMLADIKQQFIFPESLDIKYRNWGLGWCSVDCGNFIEPCNAAIYHALIDFKNSRLFKNKIALFLKALTIH